MLRKITFVCLLFISGHITGQKVVFDVNLRVNFMQSDEYVSQDEYPIWSIQRLDDTTSIRTNYLSSRQTTTDYRPNPFFEGNGFFTIRWSERFSLRTGLGLQFGSFHTGSASEFFQLEIISIDTLYQTVIPPIITSCDCFLNDIDDLGPISDRITYEMLNLAIPAEIGYDIIPGKLNLKAGAYFHTPLYAAVKRSYASVEMTTEDDMTKCEWVRVDEKNTAVSGISNFQWGVSSWLGYTILPNLEIEIGARQQMNDVYVKESYQDSRFDHNSYKPLTFSAGLSYRFNVSGKSALIE